jgi:hypothetical protein
METWEEKAGAFLAEGLSMEEADTEAAALVFSARLLNNHLWDAHRSPATDGNSAVNANIAGSQAENPTTALDDDIWRNPFDGPEEEDDDTPAGPGEKTPHRPVREGLAALKYMAGKRIALIGAYPSGAMISRQEPENFTADPSVIAALVSGAGDPQGRAKGTPISRFYFIPQDAGLLCLDIDRKPGKADGLENLYKLWGRAALPRALQDIERYFPCYVSTPSGGYHLYFKYSGPLVRKTDLAPEIEIKHGKPGLTAPGSRKENGAYVLHGNLEDAPPLYGIILDRIEELQKERQEKAQSQKAAADRPARPRERKSTGQTYTPQITLDTLADEATASYGGHHDRQVSFAGRACRCKFTAAETISYAKAHPEIFGTGADTENTILSVFRDRGAA